MDTQSIENYIVKVLQDIWNFQIVTVEKNTITLGTIALGILFLVLGIFLSKFLSRKLSQRLLNNAGLEPGALHTIESISFYILAIFFSLFAMRMANLPITIFTVMGGAIAIGIGFGSQNVVNNFISGIILMIERPIKVGDYIELDGTFGYVENIGMRATIIRSRGNVHFIVPNSSFLERNVLNWTHLSDQSIRLDIKVGVAYGSDTSLVRELLIEAVKSNEHVQGAREVLVFFDDFGDSALAFRVLFWTRLKDLVDKERIKSEIRFEIDKLFRKKGVRIPFPQRDVHLFEAAKL